MEVDTLGIKSGFIAFSTSHFINFFREDPHFLLPVKKTLQIYFIDLCLVKFIY